MWIESRVLWDDLMLVNIWSNFVIRLFQVLIFLVSQSFRHLWKSLQMLLFFMSYICTLYFVNLYSSTIFYIPVTKSTHSKSVIRVHTCKYKRKKNLAQFPKITISMKKKIQIHVFQKYQGLLNIKRKTMQQNTTKCTHLIKYDLYVFSSLEGKVFSVYKPCVFLFLL